MRTRAAQMILTVSALVVGVVQPAFNGLTMLCLGMLGVVWYLELRLQASRTAAAAPSEGAAAGREAA